MSKMDDSEPQNGNESSYKGMVLSDFRMGRVKKKGVDPLFLSYPLFFGGVSYVPLNLTLVIYENLNITF